MLRIITLLVLIVSVVCSNAHADTLRIGVLLSPNPDLYWHGQETLAGARVAARVIAEREGQIIDLIEIESPLTNHYDLHVLRDEVKKYELTSLLGATTSFEAALILETGHTWNIPTVLLYDNAWVEAHHFPGWSDYILNMGQAPEQIFISAVMPWIDKNHLQDIAVIYDSDYEWANAYGKLVAQTLIAERQDINLVKELPWVEDWAPMLEQELPDLDNTARLGIVLAGTPWNTERWITTISDAGFTAPIYIPPPVFGMTELIRLSEYTTASISFGSQFLTDPNNASEQHFVEDVVKQLGWTQAIVSTPLATRAHDAVMIIYAAWQANKDFGLQERWWDIGKTVDGLTGELRILDDRARYTVIPPAKLVEVHSDGSLQVAPYADR